MPRIIYAVISSGQAVSADLDLRLGQLGLVQVPTITSADLYVQGNFDTTSANFMRLQDAYGDIKFPTGAGSRMVLWPMADLTASYVRFETSVAQTAPRTLVALRF